jgi:hypothetical protein
MVPVIVTAANLTICRFDPGGVPLETGEMLPGGAEWETVTDVRYRKSFDVHAELRPPMLPVWIRGLGALEHQAQRSVAIVQAGHLTEWLEKFDLYQ